MKSRLAVRMPFIAPGSLQIHPSRSCPFGGRANISQDESACMKAHTRSRVSTRRSNHASCSNSPRTDNGDGFGANTSSLSVVAKSFSTHLALTSLPFNRRAQPVSRIDLLGGIFSFISSLDFVGWKAPSQFARISRSAFGQASSLTSNFILSSPRM